MILGTSRQYAPTAVLRLLWSHVGEPPFPVSGWVWKTPGSGVGTVEDGRIGPSALQVLSVRYPSRMLSRNASNVSCKDGFGV